MRGFTASKFRLVTAFACLQKQQYVHSAGITTLSGSTRTRSMRFIKPPTSRLLSATTQKVEDPIHAVRTHGQ
jgi:hypothetical protein